ncbi:capsid protein [Crucivirus-250]|nr:capsid protein [Crucivirus-250]QMW68734.1 capsid protein [Crucivirus-251]
MAAPSRKRSRWLGPALSAGFGAAATSSGYGAFAGAASALGGAIGQKFFDITGYGDYNVNKNSLLSGTVPSVGNSSTHPDGLTISHREYIGDVITSATAKTFAISDFDLNVNNPQTWEWLTQIACNYEEWVPEGILFYFKSTSGEAFTSNDASLGTVIMATNYNPYNKPFETKAEMESYEFCTNGPPTNDLIHMIECDPHEGSISTYYVSSVNSSANVGLMDKRFNTLGTFYIATTGFQGTNVNIGELWVTYQVTLLKPKLYESLGLASDSIRAVLSGTLEQDTSLYGLWPLTNASHDAVIQQRTIPYTIRTPSDSLWYEYASGNVTLHWPVYAYPTYYEVSVRVSKSVNFTAPGFSLSQSGGTFGATYAPVLITGEGQTPETGTTSIRSTCYNAVIKVPGGFICHDPSGTPSTRFSTSTALVVHLQWQIRQIPNLSLSSGYIDP